MNSANSLTIAFAAVSVFEGCVLVAMVVWVLLREAYIRSIVREQLNFTSDMASVLAKVTATIEQSNSLGKDTKLELLIAIEKVESRLIKEIERLHPSNHPPFSVTNFTGEVGGAQFGNENKQRGFYHE